MPRQLPRPLPTFGLLLLLTACSTTGNDASSSSEADSAEAGSTEASSTDASSTEAGSSDTSDTSSGGDELPPELPSVIEMTTGLSGTTRRAYICRTDNIIGGGTGYWAEGGGSSPCFTGEEYLRFLAVDEVPVVYGVQEREATVLVETSEGMIIDGEVAGLREATDITVSTADHTLTFRFDGFTFTLSAWSQN